jgi:TonB-dependent starch-binding outer membrane protein SusC
MENKNFPGLLRFPGIQGKLCLFLFGFLFLLFCYDAQAQVTRVTGIVRDLKGTALQGVSVNVKGSSAGNVTDNKGQYTVNVPNADAVLVFSIIGYAPWEETVNGRSSIDIEMLPNVTNLDEVIVVGYGTQKKNAM